MPEAGEVEAETKRVEDALDAAMPEPWKEGTDESDYDLIALTLDRMEAAAGAGQYRQAEQARLEAYAFFEFGPERRLKAFDPGLALEVEGAMWFGAGDQPGLATLIADRAPRRELRQARLALDEQLADAAATLGDSASSATVVTNSAILVFREGLEAVLILAAITASFVGVRRRLRRPVMVGALLGLLASILTWVIASTLIESLASSGERLEAITGSWRSRCCCSSPTGSSTASTGASGSGASTGGARRSRGSTAPASCRPRPSASCCSG